MTAADLGWRALAGAVVLALLMALLAGCARAETGPGQIGATSGGTSGSGSGSAGEAELVGQWSESGTGQEWVAAAPVATVVIGTDGDREAWLDGLPDGVGAQETFADLRAVDLETHFLVIGGYPRCTEYSEVTVDGDRVAFEVHATDDRDCEWSPSTIDAWAVPLTLTDGQLPELAAAS